MKRNFKSYFHTTPMGEELKIKCELNAINQENGIELIYRGTRQILTPSDVLDLYPSKVPITSIRRAITQLTKKGILIQSNMTKESEWGRPEHYWIHKDYEHLTF
tara:strand:+ start:8249 stop:8560 length:312 start_codon:yes stop_codon:yes gene_type:complete